MISQELHKVLSTLENLSPDEKDAVVKMMHGDHSGLSAMGIGAEALKSRGLGSVVSSFVPGFMGQSGQSSRGSGRDEDHEHDEDNSQ